MYVCAYVCKYYAYDSCTSCMLKCNHPILLYVNIAKNAHRATKVML